MTDTNEARNPLGRDADWILAMGHALGLNGGFRVPIVPTVEAFKELFADVRRASLAATPKPTSEQMAWVLVPAEPTPEMLAASWANAEPRFIFTDHEEHIAKAYLAMLDAAPSPAAPEQVRDAPLPSEPTCYRCKGSGTQTEIATNEGPDASTYDIECPECGGTGENVSIRSAFEAVGRSMVVEMTTTVRGIEEWPAIPELWRLCMEERDKLRAAQPTRSATEAEPLGYRWRYRVGPVEWHYIDKLGAPDDATIVEPLYAEPRPVMGGEPSDEQILDAATAEFPRWREDIQEQFVLRVVRAALRPCAPSLNPSLSSDLSAPAPSGSGTGKDLA